MEWVVNATPWTLYPQELLDTHRIGGWVSPMAWLDGCGKFAPTAILGYRTMWNVLRLQNGKSKVHRRTGHEGPEGE